MYNTVTLLKQSYTVPFIRLASNEMCEEHPVIGAHFQISGWHEVVWDHFGSISLLPILYKQLSYHIYVGVWRVVSGSGWWVGL